MAKIPDFKAVETKKGWKVETPGNMSPSGQRQRKYFGDDKRKAEKFAASLRRRYHKGERSTLLRPDEALQASEAIKLLEPLGVSLVEAARIVARLYESDGQDETFGERWKDYVSEGEMRWSKKYADQMSDIPRWVGKDFMKIPLREITDSLVASTLKQQGSKAKSTIAMRLTRINAVRSGKGNQKRAFKIEIMTEVQVAAMLEACENLEEKRAVAMLLFAGIRPDVENGEIKRLDWSTVGAEDIYVPPGVSKTGTDRHIPISPRLKSLIEGHEKGGPVAPANWKRRIYRIRKKAGIAGKADITRHTFASHFLAAFGEQKAKAAMGHTPNSDTLFRHYRRAVTEDAGRDYFGE